MAPAYPGDVAPATRFFEFAAGVGAAMAARRSVDYLHAVLGPVHADVYLLVSELVTNSIRHAGLGSDGSIRLGILDFPDRVRVEVVDRGRGFRRTPYLRPPDDHGGWGLRMVDAVADRWGISDAGGTCVWFELLKPPAHGAKVDETSARQLLPQLSLSGAASPEERDGGGSVMTEQKTGHGEMLAEISRGLVQLHRRYYGKGPTKAKTYMVNDTVMCMLKGGFTTVERTLIEDGKPEAVHEIRRIFQKTMEQQFTGLVEGATGRKVIAYMSQVHSEPDMAVELFVLEPEDPTALAHYEYDVVEAGDAVEG